MNCRIWVCSCGIITPRGIAVTTDMITHDPTPLVTEHGALRCKDPMRPATHLFARRMAIANNKKPITD